MERLTSRTSGGQAKIEYPKSCYFLDGKKDAVATAAFLQLALERLAAYEDTGLEPDEIKELCTDDVEEVAKMFRKMIESGEINHLKDLLQAEQDGRLVVLPCNVGDTIYRPGDPVKNAYEWDIVCTEIYKDEVVFRDDSDNEFTENDIGKTVFLSREEAEAALKGGEANE